MRSPSLSPMRWITVAVVAAALTACNDSSTSPGREPQVVNATDNFQYQISDIRGFTGSHVYSWQNTGTTAKINQATAITSGAVTLVLRDASGTQVYSRSLADNGTFASNAGVAGQWTIVVTYTSASATVNFRVDKAP